MAQQHFRKLLVCWLLLKIKPGCGVKISILYVMQFLTASWESLESQTISNCFKKTGFGEDMSTALFEVSDNCESPWKNKTYVKKTCVRIATKRRNKSTATSTSKPMCVDVAEHLEKLRSCVTSTSDVPSDVIKSSGNFESYVLLQITEL
ncbi:hypothetical protein PR048_008607 [Dryococelus australis]|uniref:Uncharacterized protein n=1 Tax=Dryococelus australis TaxID=614101 RepID=A0ABQ9HXL5_9NEOP|nr:hypothetical protein PR048_008607 [Dryococelus australis]